MFSAINNSYRGLDPALEVMKRESEHIPLIDSKSSTKRKLTINEVIIYLVGLSDGLIHLASLAIYYLFKDYFRLTPYQVSLILMCPYIPFILKPLIALITDSYSIFGMRRKPYLFLFSLFQSFNYLALGWLNLSATQATVILFCISLSTASCTTVAEALVVEESIGKTYVQGTNKVTEFMTAKAIGSLSVAYFSGYLIEKISRDTIFIITAAFPLIISISCLFLKERGYIPSRSIIKQTSDLINFINNPIFLGPFLYIFIYMAGPDYDDAFFYFCTNKLGFRPSFMGTLRLTYGIASLAGVLSYRIFFRRCTLKKTLISTTLISFPIYISPIILTENINTFYGISNEIFVLSGGFLIEAITEIQLLPLFILTASICQPGLEASVFATVLSVKSFGSLVRKGSSSLLTYWMNIDTYNFDNISFLIFFCGLCLLASLLVIPLLPTEQEIMRIKNKEKEKIKS